MTAWPSSRRFGYSSKSGSGACGTDKTSPIDPCSELQQMSSGGTHFYSFGGSCTGASTDLNNIFKSIAAELTAARLVPNGIS